MATNEEVVYPQQLANARLEYVYVGLLLNNPKAISMYYFLYEDCLFSDQNLLNIYKGILFHEGEAYAPEVAKRNFNFPMNSGDLYNFKAQVKQSVAELDYNIETIYTSLKKLFILKKYYRWAPTAVMQQKILEIESYERYKDMSVEEVEAAVEQLSVTNRLSQVVLNENITEFLTKNDNDLTNGVPFQFPILAQTFKGFRKGETVSFSMPSNSGKSRFITSMIAYIAFVEKKKVLIISNEMSEEKMKLCLITTAINNDFMQKLHGQVLRKKEAEILGFHFRPDNPEVVNVDANGFVIKEPGETNEDFIKRLSEVSEEFNKTVKVTDWLNEQMNNSIHFIHITDHSNDDLRKIILNYYYKEGIEYIFYDTLKTDTDNIGKGEELKKTATVLSNIAQKYKVFIGSTLQLVESPTLPINLTINELEGSRTVKEVLDTLCLIKQINNQTYAMYEYTLDEASEDYHDLEKPTELNTRYYACVVDKNRAGPKPKVLFRLNLDYNVWEEVGFLRLKQEYVQ